MPSISLYFHDSVAVLNLLKERLPACLLSDKVLHKNGAYDHIS